MNRVTGAVVVVLAWAAAGTAAAHGGGPGLHHDMEVRLDPASRSLAVTDRIHVRGRGTVAFHLAPSFTVSALSVDGKSTVPARHDGAWRVDLGSAGEHVVVFEYSGRLEQTDARPRRLGFHRPVAAAEGSFLPDSGGWYPRLAGTDFTYRIAVDVPRSQRVVVPGRLVEETVSGERYRAVFASEVPSPGMVLMAGPYVIEERDHGDIRLRTYFHPRIASLAAAYLDLAAGYIDLYDAWIGAYPLSAFHIVSSPLPVGQGYPGLTYIGARVLRLPFIRHRSLGHEVLHTWWGNGVFVDYETGNWAEGLTTFMADYAYAEKRDAKEARAMRLGWLRAYAALPAARDRPAVDFVAKVHDAAQVVGYGKVAFVFHMLRNQLGSPAFDTAIRRLWKRHKGRTAGWEDLRQAFEKASGRDLSGFFDQWLRRAGAPRLALGPVTVKKTGGRFRIAFTLSQEGLPYALEVPVTVTTAAGERRFTVALEGRETRQELYTEARPVALAVDPDFDIFRRLDPAEAPPILRDVTLGAATVTLVLAGTERGRKAARRLAERLLDSPPRFPGGAPARLPAKPVLLVGTTPRVSAFLKRAGLAGVPDVLAGRGTARVWAGRHGNAWPLVVVAADGAPALEALLRPLAHYGGKGYLVFQGQRAVDHGMWPAGTGPLTVRLE